MTRLLPQLASFRRSLTIATLLAVASGQAPAPPASTAKLLPPPANYHFPLGQTLVYSVEWHFFTAGTATVRMEAAGAEHRVISEADSAGAIGLLYTVRDRFEATFDPHTFCSIRVTKHSEEGSHKRETQIQFDYAHGKSRLDEKNLKTGEIKNVESEIPSCVTDVVTGFYYLASLPLEAGASYTIPISDGGKVADVRIHVEGRESVKTPSGTYPAIRVAADALSGPLKGRGKVWVWYSDDTSRMPVQMRAKLTWGTLLFRLQRVDRKAPN